MNSVLLPHPPPDFVQYGCSYQKGERCFLISDNGPIVGGAFMPAPPIDRPGETVDGPLADQSAVRQSIGRLQNITDLDCEISSSAMAAINRALLMAGLVYRSA